MNVLSLVASAKVKNSPPDVLLEKGVLKMCSKFTGEHPRRNAISMKLRILIALRHVCLLIFSEHLFKNTCGGLLL